MKTLKEMPYGQLGRCEFHNFMGSMINAELYSAISGINSKSLSATETVEFKRKYNLSYLGEILERYEERDIVKTKEDLRTLLVFTAQSLCFNKGLGKPEINTNQLDVFMSKVESISCKNKDIFSIGTILQISPWIDKISNSKILCDTILDELEYNKGLSFDEKVWGIYSCWDYISSNTEFSEENLMGMINNSKETKSRLLDIVSGISIESLENECDYYLYLMLIEMASNESFFAKSSNFKNKTVCNQYKKLVSLSKKEYTLASIEPLVSLFNMNKYKLLYFNYMLSMHAYSVDIETKVTTKGEVRLCQAMLYSLCENEVAYDFIVKEIKNKITSISKEKDVEESNNWRVYFKGIEKATNIFLSGFDGAVSKINYETFINLIGADISYCEFITKKSHHLLNLEYVDIFAKLSNVSKKALILNCISDNEDVNLVSRAYNLCKRLSFEKDLSISDIEKMYSFSLINEDSDYKYLSVHNFEGYLRFVKKSKGIREFLADLKLFYSKIYEVEAMQNKNVNKNSFVCRFNKCIQEQLWSIDIFSLAKDDLKIAKECQEFKDQLALLNSDFVNYCEYVMKNIECKQYRYLMGLKESDTYAIAKELFNAMPQVHPVDSMGWNTSSCYKNLESKSLTDEEKEIKQKNAKEKVKDETLEYLKTTSNAYSFKKALIDFSLDEEFVNNVKSIFVKRIELDNLINNRNEIAVGYSIIKELLKKVSFNDEELLKFSKTCLKID